MNYTSKEFGEKVKVKMDELTDGMSMAQLVNCDMMQVNEEAIKLVILEANDREPEIQERDECNTCGRTEYMCPGH